MNMFKDARLKSIWITVATFLRLWLGYQWIVAGTEKLFGPGAAVWVGNKAGVGITGFLKGALAKATGEHPAVSSWYASFIQNAALPNAKAFSYMIAWGEFLVGLGLIVGALTTAALFFGALMNLNYMLAGTTSTNPILYTISWILLVAGSYSYIIGIDYYLIPILKKALRMDTSPSPTK